MSQRELAFALEVAEGGNGVLQVRKDLFSHLPLNAVANQQQAGGSEAGGDQEHGEQKLGAHPKFHNLCLTP